MSLVVRKTSANTGDIRDTGSIPELGRSSGGGNGNPIQYFCLENPKDRGAWQVTVHGVAQSRTRLSRHIVLVCAIQNVLGVKRILK